MTEMKRKSASNFFRIIESIKEDELDDFANSMISEGSTTQVFIVNFCRDWYNQLYGDSILEKLTKVSYPECLGQSTFKKELFINNQVLIIEILNRNQQLKNKLTAACDRFLSELINQSNKDVDNECVELAYNILREIKRLNCGEVREAIVQS